MLTRSAMSQIMLIKIKGNRKFKFSIPITFGVVDELLDVLEDWIWIFEGLFPSWKKWAVNFTGDHLAMKEFSLEIAYGLIVDIFNEMRKHKGCKLLEVDTDVITLTVQLL